MSQTSYGLLTEREETASTMKALVFYGRGQIGLETVPIPRPRAGEAVIRVTLTTICGTDLHILRGEYPVKPGLIIGHEPVGIIHELGEGVTGYEVGDRVLVGAITPCGQCNFCLGETGRSVVDQSAAGSSAIPSTVLRRNTCWCRTPRQTWPKFPTSWPMSR
jgi:threonine dehydrogenase-like Zn-dependent dehydrogenase